MKKLAIVISTTLMMASNTALADPYVGLKAGITWLDDECLAGMSCDDDSASGGVLAGYNFSDFFALEAGYDYLGKFTGAGLPDKSVGAFTLAPKLSIGLTDALDIYGKFGGAYVNYGDKDDASYLGALGLEYDVMENGSLRLEYQVITDINNDIVRASANSVTLGFVYTFGHSEAPIPVVVEEVPVVEVVEEVVEVVVLTKTYNTALLDTETFALNSTTPKPESTEKLDDLVEILTTYPQATVNIVGYTDSSGPAEYNLALSEKRAQAIANVLADRGINPNRMAVSGEGESNPIASNKTAEGRAENRRVEVTVPVFEYQIEQ